MLSPSKKTVEVEVDVDINFASIEINVDVDIDEFVENLSSEQEDYVLSQITGQQHANHEFEQVIIACADKEIPPALFDFLYAKYGKECGRKAARY